VVTQQAGPAGEAAPAGADRDDVADARDRLAGQRDQAGDDRDDEQDLRDRSSEARDGAADGRDRVGVERDDAGRRRDTAADQRDRLSDPLGSALVGSPAERARREAAADRRAASEDRQASARERTESGLDRGGALADRLAGSRQRTLAEADRDVASHDRDASASDRDRASVDALTGVVRRGAGFLALDRDMARSRRSGTPLLVGFIDVDGLKRVNDTQGHAAGDRVLVRVAATLRANLRASDLVFRYGGDEFVCALPDVDIAFGEARLAQVNVELARGSAPASVTAGFAAGRAEESSAALVARADEALYRRRQAR
jgi:diguanylate cyclase (GGDEF)-like protein